MKRASHWIILAVLFTACAQKVKENLLPVRTPGIVLSNTDSTVRPADDLFRYANGGWLARTSIPAESGSWGSFHELREHNNSMLLEVLQKAAKNSDFLEGSDQRKASDFFLAGMDSLLAEKSGITPLQPLLDQVEKLNSRNDVQNFLVREDLISGDAFFGFTVAPHTTNSFAMAAYITTGGLGLPERDYYLKLDPKSLTTRDAYRNHVSRMLELSGWDAARARRATDRILLVETELARTMLSKEERRDPVRQFNVRSIGELSVMSPTVNWPVYFKALGVHEDSVIVSEPAFIRGCERVLATYPIEDIRFYLRWSLLRKSAPFLNHALVRESFHFNKKTLLGAEQIQPRWKRVMETEDGFLGEALGKLYVAAVFPPEAKAKAREMVTNIQYAFADRIKKLDWMSDSTKQRALKKLAAVTVKIGYPDKWKDYSGLTVDRTKSYYENILNAEQYLVKEYVARLGKPADRAVWEMSPQTVNAFYNPQFNEIVFPAGILQPPFYDYRADEAVNYGGIGAGIGHELSHGFDDEGSQYDATGNLKNWWSAEDLRKFKDKSKALADQFSRYEPLAGLHVQGQFTLGENIGDLGGLAAAYDGLHRYFMEANQKPGKIDGLTPDQRFFISWATIWRAKYRDEALRTQVLTNVHSPAMYRGNGSPSNMMEFYEAFGVKAGDKMYREVGDRVKIW